MAKQWGPGQAKKFARQVELGRTYYTVNEMATNLGRYEDSKTYNEHVFTERSGFTAVPMTAGGMSAIQVCRNKGPVYDAPPQGIRNVAGRLPQGEGPLNRKTRPLSRAEIRRLEGL